MFDLLGAAGNSLDTNVLSALFYYSYRIYFCYFSKSHGIGISRKTSGGYSVIIEHTLSLIRTGFSCTQVFIINSCKILVIPKTFNSWRLLKDYCNKKQPSILNLWQPPFTHQYASDKLKTHIILSNRGKIETSPESLHYLNLM